MRIVGHMHDIEQSEDGVSDVYSLPELHLISGIGDFCQIYVSYKFEPRSSLIIYTFKIVNMTNF